MKGCFVRLLFGDNLVDRREAVVREVALCRTFPQPGPLLFFCMGQENLRIAREAGWDAELLSQESVPNFTGQVERHADRHCGFIPYETNVFHAKFLAMKSAIVMGYDQAVFLDLDIGMTQPIPENFWQRLEGGREIQTALRTYHKRICRWRPDGQRTVCWASAFYLRGLAICDRLLAAAYAHPDWYEQWIMSLVTDEMLGGWTSADAYRAAGFYFSYLEQNMCFPSEVPVFQPLLNKGFSPMTKNPEAWSRYVAEVEKRQTASRES